MNKKTFIPHFEILPQEQMNLWSQFSSSKDLHFVLYGGTAIALQIGHRESVDFDFFSHEKLDNEKETKLLRAMPFLAEKTVKLTQKDENTRSYKTESGVKLSFFGNIAFGRVGTPLKSNDGILYVASLKDLLGLKLAVLTQRVEAKDYQDIYAILNHGVTLEDGLRSAKALYGNQFPPSESLRALTYFHGGDLEKLSAKEKQYLSTVVSKLEFKDLAALPLASSSLFPSKSQKKSFTLR